MHLLLLKLTCYQGQHHFLGYNITIKYCVIIYIVSPKYLYNITSLHCKSEKDIPVCRYLWISNLCRHYEINWTVLLACFVQLFRMPRIWWDYSNFFLSNRRLKDWHKKMFVDLGIMSAYKTFPRKSIEKSFWSKKL